MAGRSGTRSPTCTVRTRRHSPQCATPTGSGGTSSPSARLCSDPTYEGDAASLFAAWRATGGQVTEAVAAVPRGQNIVWLGPPLSPPWFLTGRLMETWAHGQDIVDALGLTRVPTDRLRHIADLGVRTRELVLHGPRADVPGRARPRRTDRARGRGRGAPRTPPTRCAAPLWPSACSSPSVGTGPTWLSTRKDRPPRNGSPRPGLRRPGGTRPDAGAVRAAAAAAARRDAHAGTAASHRRHHPRLIR